MEGKIQLGEKNTFEREREKKIYSWEREKNVVRREREKGTWKREEKVHWGQIHTCLSPPPLIRNATSANRKKFYNRLFFYITSIKMSRDRGRILVERESVIEKKRKKSISLSSRLWNFSFLNSLSLSHSLSLSLSLNGNIDSSLKLFPDYEQTG